MDGMIHLCRDRSVVVERLRSMVEAVRFVVVALVGSKKIRPTPGVQGTPSV